MLTIAQDSHVEILMSRVYSFKVALRDPAGVPGQCDGLNMFTSRGHGVSSFGLNPWLGF